MIMSDHNQQPGAEEEDVSINLGTAEEVNLPGCSTEVTGGAGDTGAGGATQKGKKTKKSTKTFFEVEKTTVGIVKHGIVKQYFNAWLAILCKSFKKYSDYSHLVYIDGFAGSGSYLEDEEDPLKCADDLFGSPTILYREALVHTKLPEGENCPDIYLIFIEYKQENCDKLFNQLKELSSEHASAPNVEKVKYLVIQGKFADAVKWILSCGFTFPANHAEAIVKAPKPSNLMENETPVEILSPHKSDSNIPKFITDETPLFAFVDPFGFNGKNMPMTIMKEIYRSSTKAEILINIMTGFINRFLKLDSRTRPINLLTGDHETDAAWKEKILQGETSNERIDLFLNFYRDKLWGETGGQQFSSRFEMRNVRNGRSYHLCFVCQHKRAHISMKSAMLKFSQSEHSFKFSAFKDMDQNLEVDKMSTEELVCKILEAFKDEGIVRGAVITDFINRSDTAVQRYRRELKVALANYVVTGLGDNSKYDETYFDFASPNNPTMNEYVNASSSTPERPKSAKRKRTPGSSNVKSQKKKEEERKKPREDIRKYLDFSPEKKVTKE